MLPDLKKKSNDVLDIKVSERREISPLKVIDLF